MGWWDGKVEWEWEGGRWNGKVGSGRGRWEVVDRIALWRSCWRWLCGGWGGVWCGGGDGVDGGDVWWGWWGWWGWCCGDGGLVAVRDRGGGRDRGRGRGRS